MRLSITSWNGWRASRTALCCSQLWPMISVIGSSQRRLPICAAGEMPPRDSVAPPVATKRSSASCSQYQSEESSIRLRKRASLSRSACSAFAWSVMSREIAAMIQRWPERNTWRLDSNGNSEPSLRR